MDFGVMRPGIGFEHTRRNEMDAMIGTDDVDQGWLVFEGEKAWIEDRLRRARAGEPQFVLRIGNVPSPLWNWEGDAECAAQSDASRFGLPNHDTTVYSERLLQRIKQAGVSLGELSPPCTPLCRPRVWFQAAVNDPQPFVRFSRDQDTGSWSGSAERARPRGPMDDVSHLCTALENTLFAEGAALEMRTQGFDAGDVAAREPYATAYLDIRHRYLSSAASEAAAQERALARLRDLLDFAGDRGVALRISSFHLANASVREFVRHAITTARAKGWKLLILMDGCAAGAATMKGLYKEFLAAGLGGEDFSCRVYPGAADAEFPATWAAAKANAHWRAFEQRLLQDGLWKPAPARYFLGEWMARAGAIAMESLDDDAIARPACASEVFIERTARACGYEGIDCRILESAFRSVAHEWVERCFGPDGEESTSPDGDSPSQRCITMLPFPSQTAVLEACRLLAPIPTAPDWTDPRHVFALHLRDLLVVAANAGKENAIAARALKDLSLVDWSKVPEQVICTHHRGHLAHIGRVIGAVSAALPLIEDCCARWKQRVEGGWSFTPAKPRVFGQTRQHLISGSAYRRSFSHRVEARRFGMSNFMGMMQAVARGHVEEKFGEEVASTFAIPEYQRNAWEDAADAATDDFTSEELEAIATKLGWLEEDTDEPEDGDGEAAEPCAEESPDGAPAEDASEESPSPKFLMGPIECPPSPRSEWAAMLEIKCRLLREFGEPELARAVDCEIRAIRDGLVTDGVEDWELIDRERVDGRIAFHDAEEGGDVPAAIALLQEQFGRTFIRLQDGMNQWFAIEAIYTMCSLRKLFIRAGRNDEATMVSAMALKLAQMLGSTVHPGYLGLSVAACCTHLAFDRMKRGSRSAARRLVVRAIEAVEEVEKTWPIPSVVHTRIEGQLALADLERRVGLVAESERRVQESLQEARTLLGVPEIDIGRRWLCPLVERAAAIESSSGDFGIALNLLEECIVLCDVPGKSTGDCRAQHRVTRAARDAARRLRRLDRAESLARSACECARTCGVDDSADRAELEAIVAERG
jgi:hypothetical protein